MNRLLVKLMALGVVAATLAGCSSNPVSGAPQLVMRSEKSEVELGRTMHAQTLAQNSPYPDSDLQEYVNSIGQALAATSERSHLDFHFVVLDEDIVNAFALPGGYIYVTRGLLAHLNNEAELAAVLGHEIGHVTARHSIGREAKGKLASIASVVAAVATGSSAAGTATNMASGALISGYSRDQELQADALGAKYIAKLGYPTKATSDAVELLKRREQFEIERARAEGRQAMNPHGVFSTHPPNDERFAEAVAAAKQYASEAELGYREQPFLDRIDGLKWGPKKSPGTFRNNIYYNARYGVKVKFPDNWRVSGEPARIMAVSPDNQNTLQMYVMRVKRGIDPQDLLQKALAIPSVRDGKNATVSGMPVFLATADRYESPYGGRPARTAAIVDERRGLAYIFAGSGKRDLSRVAADGEFIGAIFSLDRMKREEANLAKAPKLKVVRVESDTTIADLARNSSIPAFAEQHLRLINGLYPAGEPVAGQLIKTID